jgi:hypothetical protein
MRCPNCGGENPISQQYCRTCGMKIDVDFGVIQESVELDAKEAEVARTTTALMPIIALFVVANIIVWVFASQIETRVRTESLLVPTPLPPEMPVAPLAPPPLPAVPGAAPHLTAGPSPLPDHVSGPSERFGFRRDPTRRKMHLARGGTTASLDAIGRGLECLASHQTKGTGAWPVAGNWANGREAWGSCAVTGLAVLALLGDGHVWTGPPDAADPKGDLGRAAGLGVRYLVGSQDASGRIGPAKDQYMYNHGIATAALAEAYAMSGLPQLKPPAQKAISFLARSQRPNGGWDYTADDGKRSDMSVTVWQLTALDAARRAGLDVPTEAFVNAQSFVYMMTSSKTARARYETEHYQGRKPSFSPLGPTAMALACKAMLRRPGCAEDVTGQAAILLGKPPAWDPAWTTVTGKPLHVYSYWFHGTVGMRPLGERSWREWYAAATKAILAAQDLNDGSWPPAGKWAHAGGRVYSTSLAILTLQATYRNP